VLPYLSKGEGCLLAFAEGIDYRDRYLGALIGQSAGARLGAAGQGLSAEDVRALYGRIDGPPDGEAAAGSRSREAPCFNGSVRRSVSGRGRVDPEEIAAALSDEIAASDASAGERMFAANFRERRFPWFEAGEPVPESAPAARCVPVALLHSADFRSLKLESGILAAIASPHPSSVAGAILLAVSIARLLHSDAGSVDPIQFARGSAAFVAGIESDRGAGPRGRGAASLARKVGTELPALLLRRAPAEEIARAFGTGPSPAEGIPFSLACVLSNPSDFREALLSAVNAGGEAIRNGAMAGALSGALLGASAIPEGWIRAAGGREEFEGDADRLLAGARGET
jgi:ADP-ribosylglycohydrolase